VSSISETNSYSYASFTNKASRLHKEICDLYEYIRPQDFEQTIRTELVEELRNRVRDKWPDSDILSFGSFAAGLYLPDSDMDLVMVSDSYMRGRRAVYDRRSHLHLFYDFIDRRGISAPGSAEIVATAKVPLVKYVDRRTGLRVDISFENDSGLHAVPTFLSWKATFPAMPIIVPLIKHFLAMRGLNEVFTGGLGGFSVTCLVVSLLQNMPQVASGNLIAEQHLGEVLMEFFDLYGNLLNFSTTAIRVDRPGYIEKVR
jgi:non-canonical poly(A) RNA polymerase PAPD5/7